MRKEKRFYFFFSFLGLMIINSVWCEHKPTNQPKMRGKGKQEKHVCVGGGGDAVSGRPWLISLQSSRSSSWRLFFCSQTTERRSQFFIFFSSSSSNVSIWLKTWLVRERVSSLVAGQNNTKTKEKEKKKREFVWAESLFVLLLPTRRRRRHRPEPKRK